MFKSIFTRSAYDRSGERTPRPEDVSPDPRVWRDLNRQREWRADIRLIQMAAGAGDSIFATALFLMLVSPSIASILGWAFCGLMSLWCYAYVRQNGQHLMTSMWQIQDRARWAEDQFSTLNLDCLTVIGAIRLQSAAEAAGEAERGLVPAPPMSSLAISGGTDVP